MRRFLTLLALLATLGVHAQSDPPALPYVAAQDPFRLPEGVTFGPVASVAINSAGNIFVFYYIGDVFNWRVQKFSPAK